MSQLLLLQCLLYLDLTGHGACNMTNEHCFAMKSGSYLKPYNRVCSTAGVTIAQIDQIKQFFGSLPFTWIVPADDSDTAHCLQDQGLKKVAEFPAMRADISSLAPNLEAPELLILPAESSSEIEAWVSLTAKIYAYDPTQLNCAISYLRDAGGCAVKLYLGWCENRPVCAGMAIYHDAIVTLHTIGTLPEYRNRGFGYAFTYHILQEAAQAGCTDALLLAAPMGKSLYDRLGFEHYAVYHFYALAG